MLARLVKRYEKEGTQTQIFYCTRYFMSEKDLMKEIVEGE
jgi:hypothetical protein